MQLPNNAYDADFSPEFDSIAYFPKHNSKPNKLLRVCLPPWLIMLVEQTVDAARQEGAEEARRQIRDALHVLPSK